MVDADVGLVVVLFVVVAAIALPALLALGVLAVCAAAGITEDTGCEQPRTNNRTDENQGVHRRADTGTTQRGIS